MLARAFDADVPARWVVADAFYGRSHAFRRWLEERGRPYALMIPKTKAVWYQGRRERAEQLGERLCPEPALGPWACLELSEACAAGMRRWLLVRCDAEDPDEHAYFLAYGPAETTVAELVRVCDTRWQIEEGFAQAKGEVGLDQYEVRKWEAWHRLVTLCLLAHAYLVVMRQAARQEEARGKGGADPGLIPLTVPEVRRLVLAMGEAAERRPFRLGWSRWRRAHQAVAARCHAARRALRRSGPAARPRRTAARSGRGGADRRRVAPRPAAAAAAAAGDGATAARPPHRARRHPLGGALRRLVARDAGGIRQVGDGLQAVSALVRHRPLAAHPRGAARGRTLSVAVGTVQPVEKGPGPVRGCRSFC